MTFDNPDLQGIAWIDVESTGLNPYEGESLLQIACYVTDPDLNILDEGGFERVIKYTQEEADELYRKTSKYVQDMHTATGLWDRLVSHEAQSIPAVDVDLTMYIQQFFPQKKTVWLGGNSIFLDRQFTNFNLPTLAGFLHYRSVDVTSFAGLARSWYGEEAVFEKRRTHDARDDIMESIEELRFYRKILFK